MCSQFLQSGNCTRPNCAFAHDERELRTTVGFFKTKLCRFASSGRCRHGESCRFAHEITELSPEGQRLYREEAAANANYEMMGREQVPGSQTNGSVDTPRGGQSGSQSGTGGSHQSGASADSDQSTRADASAYIPTPEGSGDSGQESDKQLDQHLGGSSGWRGGNAGERDRRDRRSGALRGRHCTTLMITNVPSFLTQGALVSLLEDLTVCMRGAFDFFYCPWNPHEDKNLGYAMINFFSRSTAADFERQWSGETLLPQRSPGAKKLRIVPAALQGRAANIRHFSGFALAHQADPRFRPLVRAGPTEALQPMALSEELGRNAQRQQPETVQEEEYLLDEAQQLFQKHSETLLRQGALAPYLKHGSGGHGSGGLGSGGLGAGGLGHGGLGSGGRWPGFGQGERRQGADGDGSFEQPWAMMMQQGLGGMPGLGPMPYFPGLGHPSPFGADDLQQGFQQ